MNQVPEVPPREGERVVCIRPYLAVIDHPHGEHYTTPGDWGTVDEVDERAIYVIWDHALPGLEGDVLSVTETDAAADGRTMYAHFWWHFAADRA